MSFSFNRCLATGVPIVIATLAAPAFAQDAGDALERIEVTVTGAAGPILTVDHGSDSGIAKGDNFILRGSSLRPLTGVVTGTTEHSAQIELDDIIGAALVLTGARGEILVPRERARTDGAESDIPEHPPWQEPVDTWAPGKPLLAPARSPEPDERDPDLRGRIYMRSEYTDDSQGDRTYSRWWTGVDLDWSNPFGRGGVVRFKGELSYRDYLTGSDSADETLTRVQRLSYNLGGNDGDPYRMQVGRFLPSLFPEFGLIDGVEYIRRTDGNDQFGASLGYLPDYDDDLAGSDDLSAALFYRWVESPEEKVAISLGYQKTWHAGEADRDLLASSFHWIVGPRTTVRGSVLFDYYDSTAVLESEGLQLTRLHTSLDQRIGDGASVGLYASILDWPELLKNELPLALAETIADQQVERGGLRGWTRFSDKMRLYGNVDAWRDNQNSGNHANVRLVMRDLLYDESELSVGFFETQGSFSDGLGTRIQHTHWIGASALRLGFDSTRYTQSGFQGEQRSLQQHLVRLGADTRVAGDIDLSAELSQRFGDEQDSFSAQLRATWRF